MTSSIKPDFIVVYILKKQTDIYYLLLLRRCSSISWPGSWQPVTGSLEHNETSTQAAQREVLEETGLPIEQLYAANYIESYYDIKRDLIQFCPVFVAFVQEDKCMQLCALEHDQYQWVRLEQALAAITSPSHHPTVTFITNYFINRPPDTQLKIC